MPSPPRAVGVGASAVSALTTTTGDDGSGTDEQCSSSAVRPRFAPEPVETRSESMTGGVVPGGVVTGGVVVRLVAGAEDDVRDVLRSPVRKVVAGLDIPVEPLALSPEPPLTTASSVHVALRRRRYSRRGLGRVILSYTHIGVALVLEPRLPGLPSLLSLVPGANSSVGKHVIRLGGRGEERHGRDDKCGRPHHGRKGLQKTTVHAGTNLSMQASTGVAAGGCDGPGRRNATSSWRSSPVRADTSGQCASCRDHSGYPRRVSSNETIS